MDIKQRAKKQSDNQSSCTLSNVSSLCPSSVSGAYLVPYFILLLLIGIPLFFLELAVGQRIRRGSIGVWNYVYPQLGGIGVSSLMVSANMNSSIKFAHHAIYNMASFPPGDQ